MSAPSDERDQHATPDHIALKAADFSLEDAPVTFYVARHGQTLFNIMGKVQGWCDTPLTDEGVRAAEALGRGLANTEFSAAFSSDSGRAVQTLNVLLDARAIARGEKFAQPETLLTREIANEMGNSDVIGTVASADAYAVCGHGNLPFPLAHDPRLREWCYGDLEGEPGELLHATLAAGFGEVLPSEEHNRRLPEVADVLACADASGRAETFADIERRLRGFFWEAGEAVRLAGGGNVLVVTHSFVVRTIVYLLDPSRVNDPVKIPNTSITRIGYDGTHFSLSEIGSTAWLSD